MMDLELFEVKSTLWQKLLALFIFLLLSPTGGALMLSPFVPAFHINPRTGQPTPFGSFDVVLALAMGLFLLILGCGLAWSVFRYSIRADRKGLSQTNGLFRQSVQWSEVASYYKERNKRHHSEVHIEPVLLNAQGELIFQGYAPVFVSTRRIMAQRQKFWSFVEERLEGKQVAPPSPDLDPEVLALRSLEVKWSEKSWAWKIARVFALLAYVLFWVGLAMGPLYYVVTHNISVPQLLGALWGCLMFLGPLLPHFLWLEWKKRQIVKEMERSGRIKK